VRRAVATAAVLSDDRVVFGGGVGAGWMAAEFALTDQRFSDRGGRLDEMLAVLPRLWSCEWVEHRGRYYDLPAVQISPRPARPVGRTVRHHAEPSGSGDRRRGAAVV
jgi:alkanesulfonate monooxygenase SsuD/methylene tetrahydromethanopterin reductase-like flavin-dependent oxidoreductase (luciferase family)